MTGQIPQMIDMMFDLEGGMLPAAYPFALWEALTLRVPELAEDESTGILPVRGTGNKEGLLLTKRAKLVMRLPTASAKLAAARLTGQQFDIAGRSLRLGATKTRPIYPFPTVHAQLVAGTSDELFFVENINEQLERMGIKGKLICGRRRSIGDESRSVQGFSLVIHDLKAEDSLRLQFIGLGTDRHFGCGIFVPSKVISGLSED
jgi:CRISPR-associated protein Cas6